MVRIGEYSPNNPDYLGAACGILGLGEYEEKRKYYSEQRKNEYKEYLAQQSLKLPAVNGMVDRTKKGVRDDLGETLRRTEMFSSTVQKHTSTQTESLGKDASTNTESNPELSKAVLTKQYNLLKDNGDAVCRTRNSPSMPKNITNHERNNLISPSSFGTLSFDSEKTSGKLDSPREFSLKCSPNSVRRGVLKDLLNQDFSDSESLGMQAKTARRRWRDNAASYDRDLRAQVEERQKLKRELEEKERQEALARDRWVAEKRETALSRQRDEEGKAKAREDLRKRRMDDFSHCQEGLKKEAEERRHAHIRQRILESQTFTPDVDSDTARGRHSPKDKLFGQPDQVMNSPRKSLNSPLIPVQDSEVFRNTCSSPRESTREIGTNPQTGEVIQLEDKWCLTPVKGRDGTKVPSGPSLSARNHHGNNSRGSLSKPASARVPKNVSLPSGMIVQISTSMADNSVKDRNASHNMEEKVPHDRIPLTNLAEIRRQLKMDQMRMEDAIRRHNEERSNTNDSLNN